MITISAFGSIICLASNTGTSSATETDTLSKMCCLDSAMDLMHWRTNGILFRSKWEATSTASIKEGGWVVYEMVQDGKLKTRVFMAHLGFFGQVG